MSKNRQARRREAAKQRHAAQQSASRPALQRPSPSRGRQAARAIDGFAPLRDALGEIAAERGDWAGIPMPLDGERLIVEPSYPNAEAFMAMGGGREPDPDDDDDGWRLRNKWYSIRHRCDILVMEKDGKVSWGKLPAMHHLGHDLSTLGCSEAWGLEQEQKALMLLAELVSHRQMKHYVLTGMFLETSKRSGVTYLFRRLKPTVAISTRTGTPRILACLCMHPIAYYANSWAGAMCPTDDVIAHLQMMRADEHMFWKRANHHPPYRPEAGL